MLLGMRLEANFSSICFCACLFLFRNASLTSSVGTVVLMSPIFYVPPKFAISAGPRLFSMLITKNSLEKYWIFKIVISCLEVR